MWIDAKEPNLPPLSQSNTNYAWSEFFIGVLRNSNGKHIIREVNLKMKKSTGRVEVQTTMGIKRPLGHLVLWMPMPLLPDDLK